MSHVSKQKIAHVARFENIVGARRTFRKPKLRTLCIAKKSQGYTAKTKSERCLEHSKLKKVEFPLPDAENISC